ncbi:hypothetical protein OMX41_003034 [Shigella flexneri]|nr:hypothetical protein [Shigella flexneri]EJI6363087.1 hypothetical protein [Shigella flexneri]EKB0104665.1 hypothetical protein [Shigella flexneri]
MKLGPVLAGGSFPAIRQVTGRKARGFSLFMKIFRFKAFPFFFFVTSCFYLKHPLKRKETTGAENELLGLCRFLSRFLFNNCAVATRLSAAGTYPARFQ